MLNGSILLEGSYLYYDKDQNYSQENFKLVELEDSSQFHVYSEIISRLDTGEMLKILVRLEMNQSYLPIFLRVERSVGQHYAQEVFKLDPLSKELKYSFQSAQTTQEFKKIISAKHYLSSPAFSTSCLFTLSKSFNATGRTPITIISSSNYWEYLNAPEEKIIFAEYKSKEATFQINQTNLLASHLCLYERDSSESNPDTPAEIFISKHYGIPYELVHGDQKIVIKNLKKNF